MDTLDLKRLKMIAQDLEDLQIMSAHLQDAIVHLSSMSYDSETKTFRLLANRFCWEHGEMTHEDEPLYHRVHSGLEVHHVKRVLHKGIDMKGEKRAHNLLAIHNDDPNAIHVVFSDGGELRLEVEDVKLHLGDVQHPWPTRKKPTHIHEHLEK